MSEDRFIPSRKLIPEFDMFDVVVRDENTPVHDPQIITVAEIYSEEILGRHAVRKGSQNENDI